MSNKPSIDCPRCPNCDWPQNHGGLCDECRTESMSIDDYVAMLAMAEKDFWKRVIYGVSL